MSYPIFKKGQPGFIADSDGRFGTPAAQDIPTLPRDGMEDPASYIIHEDLSHAINVALLLGMPLLVTGEPGAGKTELGRAIAHELNAGDPLVFETKSTSQAKDLFYTFDVLGRYGAPHVKGSLEAKDYITYQALGRAILDAFEFDKVAKLLPEGARANHRGPRRSVVIIDEIDKAPRDFPNDLLTEIDRMAFRVPELDGAATPGMDRRSDSVPVARRPIVIITSNSEKGLPDPFLRRCIYFNIDFPSDDDLKLIVDARIGKAHSTTDLAKDALEIFKAFRDDAGRTGLQDKPGTAELLNWLQALNKLGFNANSSLRRPDAAPLLVQSLVALVKDPEDRPKAARYVRTWCGATD
jgi:MoxR-like ATPase